MTSVDTVTREIIGSAIEVHKVLGPGLLESAYELALAIELGARGISFDRQVRCPVFYRGHCVGDYRLDLLVADRVTLRHSAGSGQGSELGPIDHTAS